MTLNPLKYLETDKLELEVYIPGDEPRIFDDLSFGDQCEIKNKAEFAAAALLPILERYNHPSISVISVFHTNGENTITLQLGSSTLIEQAHRAFLGVPGYTGDISAVD